MDQISDSTCSSLLLASLASGQGLAWVEDMQRPAGKDRAPSPPVLTPVMSRLLGTSGPGPAPAIVF
jgi:hypothetical protein